MQCFSHNIQMIHEDPRLEAACDDDWDPEVDPAYLPRQTDAGASSAPPNQTAAVGVANRLVQQNDASRKAAAPIPFPHRSKPGHIPALFCRSAVCGAYRSSGLPAPAGSRDIDTQGKYALTLEGPRLSMKDKAVFEAIVRLAKQAFLDLNDALETSLSSIAKEAGCKSAGGSALAWVSESLGRLRAARLSYRLLDGAQGGGRLIDAMEKSVAGVSIRFDASLILDLYGKDRQFRIDWARRGRLSSPLAQWLHDFFSTHEEGDPLTLGYLRKRSGFAARPKNFHPQLDAALDDIKKLAPGLVAGHSFDMPSRELDRWALKVSRGSEKPEFEIAKASKADKARKAQPRRGGPAL